MRAFMVAAIVALAACAPEPPSPDIARGELLEVATPVVSATIGQPVSLEPGTVNIQDDWAWLIVQPRSPSGGELDWSTTHFAEDAALGVLDGGGTTYVLLKRENGAWRVLDHVVGPTDVAWSNWPTQYGAPPELLGLPPA